MTVAVTLFALLELYKRGEVDWTQQESFGEIAVRATHVRADPGEEPFTAARGRTGDGLVAVGGVGRLAG
jgi:hypothetical protein